jgi:DNA-binding transcriptional ArsR family regulator
MAMGLLLLRVTLGHPRGSWSAEAVRGSSAVLAWREPVKGWRRSVFVPGRRYAFAGVVETAGGVLLALGLATPLAAALADSVGDDRCRRQRSNEERPSSLSKAASSTHLIVEALLSVECAVNDLVARLDIHQSGVSRHLRILDEAGFVRMRSDGPRCLYSLRPEPFQELDAWVTR